MTTDNRSDTDRLTALERRLARTRRLLVLPFLLVPLAFALGAAEPQKFVDLVCGSVEVKNAAGKTTAKVSAAGDAELAGKLTVGGLDVTDRLKTVETRLDGVGKQAGKLDTATLSGALVVECLPVMVRGGGNNDKNDIHPGCPEILANKNGCAIDVKDYRGTGLTPIAAWWSPGSQPSRMTILPNYTKAEPSGQKVVFAVNAIGVPQSTYVNVYVLCVKN